MHTWINQAEEKIAKLNKELADLRKSNVITSKTSSVGLKELRTLTIRATQAAARSGRAAAKSLIAAKRVANGIENPTAHILLISIRGAEIAAEMATKFAAESTLLILEVLMAARTVATNDKEDKETEVIKDSMTAVLITIRSAEAATAATRLAQSVAAFASSLPLTPNISTRTRRASGGFGLILRQQNSLNTGI